MKDFFSFRRMITPYIIMIIFWVAIVVLVISLVGASIGLLSSKSSALFLCLIWPLGLPLGVLVIRIYCELLILFFRMNETLTDIKNALSNRPLQ